MTAGGRWRLFVAAEVPGAHLTALAAATDPLRDRFPRARWIPAENQHITLKFLGSTDVDLVPAVGEVLVGVAATARPAEISIAGVGAFPSLRRASVLWAGVNDPNGLLGALAAGLSSRFEVLGFEPERRPHVPHLTLARFRAPVRLDDPVPAIPELDPFPVAEVVLYRSHTSSKGARYEPLVRVPLLG